MFRGYPDKKYGIKLLTTNGTNQRQAVFPPVNLAIWVFVRVYQFLPNSEKNLMLCFGFYQIHLFIWISNCTWVKNLGALFCAMTVLPLYPERFRIIKGIQTTLALVVLIWLCLNALCFSMTDETWYGAYTLSQLISGLTWLEAKQQ